MATTAEDTSVITVNVLMNDIIFVGASITSFEGISKEGGLVTDNGDGTFTDHVISMGGSDLYMLDGVIVTFVDDTALDYVDLGALLDDVTNDFHALEIRLDFHADLIAELGLTALDEIPLSFNL